MQNDSTLKSANDLGLIPTIWNVDSQDWMKPGVNTIVSKATQKPYDGKDPVVLMHDGGVKRNQTLNALPRIIQYYKNKGYSFSTFQ